MRQTFDGEIRKTVCQKIPAKALVISDNKNCTHDVDMRPDIAAQCPEKKKGLNEVFDPTH